MFLFFNGTVFGEKRQKYNLLSFINSCYLFDQGRRRALLFRRERLFTPTTAAWSANKGRFLLILSFFLSFSFFPPLFRSFETRPQITYAHIHAATSTSINFQIYCATFCCSGFCGTHRFCYHRSRRCRWTNFSSSVHTHKLADRPTDPHVLTVEWNVVHTYTTSNGSSYHSPPAFGTKSLLLLLLLLLVCSLKLLDSLRAAACMHMRPRGIFEALKTIEAKRVAYRLVSEQRIHIENVAYFTSVTG